MNQAVAAPSYKVWTPWHVELSTQLLLSFQLITSHWNRCVQEPAGICSGMHTVLEAAQLFASAQMASFETRITAVAVSLLVHIFGQRIILWPSSCSDCDDIMHLFLAINLENAS